MKLNAGKYRVAFGWLLGSFLFLGHPEASYTCTICIPFPTRTLADYLIESESVVLARENPDKPWSYQIVEHLKGEQILRPIDNFLNSSTRRLLRLHPERGVVFVLENEDDWRSLGFANQEYESLVREVLRRAPTWRTHDPLDESRLAFFADYLGHENRALHELAYLELGRAPYGQIKQLGSHWSLEQVRAWLRNPAYFEWYPLAILVLAQSGDERDHDHIAGRFSSLASFGLTTNLAAWATALIEIRRQAAIDEIETSYFRSPARSKEELAAVIAALSVHGSNGHTHLVDRIVRSYATLIENHPEMASRIATDLMAWRRHDLADQMAEALQEVQDTDPLGAYAIRMYLAQSPGAIPAQ